jgi:short-subunit dehydrogenase
MNNPTVFITGASQGLGREMALEFARRGCNLGLSARREEVLNELRDEILGFSQVDVKVYPLDASDTVSVQTTLQKTGECGLPGSACYSASKAAVAIYMDALRAENHHRKNVDITLLCPGYIDTPMNRDLTVRPFVISTEKGGRILVDKIIAKRKKTFVPSVPWAMVAPIIRNLPTGIIAKIFS